MEVRPPSTSREVHASPASMRLGLGVLALALLWIAVFWLTPARPKEQTPISITFDDSNVRPAELFVPHEPDPQPETTVEAVDAPEPESGVIPPEFVTYVVQPDDTAATISQAVYGTDQYWRRVMKSEPEIDFTKLRAGQTIRVAKDPNNIQGLPVGEAKKIPPEPAYTQYIVQRNDTLTEIAKDLYGKASLWTRIRDANPGTINREGTNIRPGMVLNVPPPPSGG